MSSPIGQYNHVYDVVSSASKEVLERALNRFFQENVDPEKEIDLLDLIIEEKNAKDSHSPER